MSPGACWCTLFTRRQWRLISLTICQQKSFKVGHHPAERLRLHATADKNWTAAVCVDTPELAGDSIVFLTSERQEWLAGRYISCAWDMPELMARRKEIVEKDLLKLQVRFQ